MPLYDNEKHEKLFSYFWLAFKAIALAAMLSVFAKDMYLMVVGK